MQIKLEQINKLGQINKKAAKKASYDLSSLIGRPGGVKISMANLKYVKDLGLFVGAEEVVVGVYLIATGEIQGAALLIFPRDMSFILSDLLAKREPGTTQKLTGLDKSALKEVGNIIAGNYLSILGNTLKIRGLAHPPNFILDTVEEILNQINTKIAYEIKNALVIEVKLIFKPEKLKGYLVLLFEIEKLKTILNLFAGY
jgi:chemotaxis protein CheC